MLQRNIVSSSFSGNRKKITQFVSYYSEITCLFWNDTMLYFKDSTTVVYHELCDFVTMLEMASKCVCLQNK